MLGFKGCSEGVHQYEARYDKGEPQLPTTGARFHGVDPVELMETLRPVTYVRDVCVKCGKIIERAQNG